MSCGTLNGRYQVLGCAAEGVLLGYGSCRGQRWGRLRPCAAGC